MTARVLVASASRPASRAMLSAALLAVLVILVLWPFAVLIATGLPALPRLGTAPLGALARTLALAATSTALTLGLALLLAYVALRTTVPGGALTGRLLLAALLAPPLVPPLALRLVADVAAVPPPGFAALVLAQVLTFLPWAYLAVGHALGALHPDQEDVAESLGAGRWRILSRITLAVLRPRLLVAASGVFVLCAGDFVNPALLGGPYVVLSTEVFAAVTRGDDLAGAVATALWLLAPCLAVAALGRGGMPVTTPVARRRPFRPMRAALAIPLSLVAALVALAVLAAHALVLAGALAPSGGVGTGFTLRHLVGALSDRAFADSVALAAAVAVLGTLLALAVAALVARRAPLAAALDDVARLPGLMPGLVLGLAYVVAAPRGAPAASGILWVTVAAVVVARLPVAVAAAVAVVRGLQPDLTRAALSLGVARVTAFSRVLAPLLGDAAASLLVYFFVRALVAVSVVVFLTTRERPLASVAALAEGMLGGLGPACAHTVALSLAVLVAVGLRRALPGRQPAAVWFL